MPQTLLKRSYQHQQTHLSLTQGASRHSSHCAEGHCYLLSQGIKTPLSWEARLEHRELHSSPLTLVFASLTCLAEPVALMAEPMQKGKLVYRGQSPKGRKRNYIPMLTTRETEAASIAEYFPESCFKTCLIAEI